MVLSLTHTLSHCSKMEFLAIHLVGKKSRGKERWGARIITKSPLDTELKKNPLTNTSSISILHVSVSVSVSGIANI